MRSRLDHERHEICANVAAAQRKLAREIAANEPPAETPIEELPPMPDEGQM